MIPRAYMGEGRAGFAHEPRHRWRAVATFAAGLLFTVALALESATASAAPFDWDGRDWEGCAEFLDLARSELGTTRVSTPARLDLHALQPQDGVIIIHPERTLDVEGFARFLKAGGRLILLDDYGTGDALLAHFGMERVAMPPQPAEALRGNPSLAIAEPASVHPVVNEVARVVTNHATGIRHPDLTPVLEVRASSGPAVLVAVAGAVANGRLLAVGDSSVVMNSMLGYAGNKMFARNLLHYAADDEGGRGKGHVYLVEGAFEQAGTFGESPEKSLWAERARALRDGLAAVRTEGFPPPVTYIFAVLVGLGVVMWTGSRAGRTHKSAPPRFTRAVPLTAQGGVAGHAAVIAAPRTTRLLAMLELKNALEEQLCSALGLAENPGHTELLGGLEKNRWVAPETVASLRSLFLRMAEIETMMLSQRSGATMASVRDREVLVAAGEVRRIMHAVREGARRRGPNPRPSAGVRSVNAPSRDASGGGGAGEASEASEKGGVAR